MESRNKPCRQEVESQDRNSRQTKPRSDPQDTSNEKLHNSSPARTTGEQANRVLKPRRKTKSNEQIRSRSCHWHSCRSKRNSNSAVTNELSGQRGRPPKHSPSERAACQVARACSENPALLTHTMHHHISPISPPSPTHSPRLQAHARSCPCPVPAILRSSTRSCNSHGPHALAVRSSQSPQRQPFAKRHAAMEPSVCQDQTHTQAQCKNGIQHPRTCLQMQAVNAGRPSNAAGARAGSGKPRERACDTHSDGQRPGYHHPPACPRTATRRGYGRRACLECVPQGVCAYQGGATWGAAARILLR